MRTKAFALILFAAAACGGSSGTEPLSGPAPGSSSQSSATAPHTAPAPKTGRSASPEPSVPASTSRSGTASAGSASAGPGRISSSPISPSPRPTPRAVAGTITVTDDDRGATVRLAVGLRLRVRLSRGMWDPPASSGRAVVVRRTSSGGYPSDQPVDATFEAVARGSAVVTATSDAACFHAEPRCLMPSRQWQVTVVVR